MSRRCFSLGRSAKEFCSQSSGRPDGTVNLSTSRRFLAIRFPERKIRNEATGTVLRQDLELQRLLHPPWALESVNRMGGDVSSSVFVTLGWSSAERELPLRLTQSASVFFFVCFRLRLPPISSISVFVYLRLPTFSSAYVVIYLRFRLSLSQCHVVVPEGVDCVSGDLHSRVWKPRRCVCVC